MIIFVRVTTIVIILIQRFKIIFVQMSVEAFPVIYHVQITDKHPSKIPHIIDQILYLNSFRHKKNFQWFSHFMIIRYIDYYFGYTLIMVFLKIMYKEGRLNTIKGHNFIKFSTILQMDLYFSISHKIFNMLW